MTGIELIKRITVNPAIFGGKPIPWYANQVKNVSGLLEPGLRPEEILAE